MRSLLVASQKGGVGKTTTAVNLATLAAQAEGGVLLLDADPLGSIAASLHLSRDANAVGEHLPAPCPIAGVGVIWRNVQPGVDVISPYPDGDTSETHLQAFLDALAQSNESHSYHLLIIDAPPMLGPRPRALLRFADEVLLIQRAEPMSIRTLPTFLQLIQESLRGGGHCQLRGVLLTLGEGVSAGGPAEARLRARFPGLLSEVIPFDTQVARALVLGCPVVVSSPESAAAIEYQSLVRSLGLAQTPELVGVGASTFEEAQVAIPTQRPSSFTKPAARESSVKLPASGDLSQPSLPERVPETPAWAARRDTVKDLPPVPAVAPVPAEPIGESDEPFGLWFVILTLCVAASAFGLGYWLMQR